MYKKVRGKLTFLFTTIASLILITMSIIYLYMSQTNLKKNCLLSFQSDVNSILTHIEANTILYPNLLQKLSSNGKYLLSIYDSGTPLLLNQNYLTDDEKQISEHLYKTKLPSLTTGASKSSCMHKEFSYSDNNKHYYACVARVRNTSHQDTEVVILFSLDKYYAEAHSQMMAFIIINVLGVFALWIFCYFFTGRLLHPLWENQKSQTAFLAAASHELRTPLAVILSANHILKQMDDGHLDPKAPSASSLIETIEKEGQRMTNLVNDMMMLAKTDSGNIQYNMVPTELDTLLIESYEAFYPLAKVSPNHITLKISLPEESLPSCVCDPDRIKQVFAILLSNAISYSNPNGHIWLRVTSNGKHAVFTVSDDGIGISKEAQPHIFERFYREDDSRSTKEHSGLGLSIAKEIISAHHGVIQVSDRPGGGSVFIFTLPV